jgi:hypothetical protein
MALDDFTRGNSGTLGASWTDVDAGFGIVSNEAKFATAGVGSSRYTGRTWANDQWAQVKIGTVVSTTTDEGGGVALRLQAGGDGIFFQGNTHETRCYKRRGSTYTQLGTDGPALATGDILYAEIVGTTINIKKGSTSICGSPIDASGGTGVPASGDAGVWAGGNGASVDDFDGADLSAAAALLETEWYPTEPQGDPLNVSVWG